MPDKRLTSILSSSSLLLFLPVIILNMSCNPSMQTYKRSQLLMGTIVEITVAADREETTDKAITAAFKEIRRLEEIMSTYIPSSDISMVNAAAGINPVKVHRDLILAVKKRGMKINLGGIGKGIAADYAYNILNQHGIKSGIIAVAGDLKTFGKRPDGKLWNVGITHPRRKGDIIANVHL